MADDHQAVIAERAVEQRESYDCMTACLATIFGCSYEEAPILADPRTGDPVDQWLRVMTLWLHGRGFHPQSFGLTEPMMKHYTPERSPWYWPTYWMGGVKSPRYDGEHAVVMHGSDLVWDPHPQREQGHLGFTSAEIFLPQDPAALGSLVQQLQDAETALDELREALRPFAESWDFHAADYLVDGEEQRILPAKVVGDMIAAVRVARAALASSAGRETEPTQ